MYKLRPQTLDYLAQHLKAKLVYPPITAYAKEMIVSANRNDRASALEALGVIAEGCNDSMRKHVKTLVNEIILPGAADTFASYTVFFHTSSALFISPYSREGADATFHLCSTNQSTYPCLFSSPSVHRLTSFETNSHTANKDSAMS